MKYLKYGCYLFVIIVYCSCRKPDKIQRPEYYQGDSYSLMFEGFWEAMNVNYPLWDVDSTDWDKVYTEYKPLFDKLDIGNVQDGKRANRYFSTMLAKIQDGHFSFQRGNFKFFPVEERYKIQRATDLINDGIPEEHYTTTIPDIYLNPGNFIKVQRQDTYVSLGEIKANPGIFYLRISEFPGFADTNAFGNIFDRFVTIIDKSDDVATRGLIIDVRNNPGGVVDDLDFVVGKLLNKKLHYGANRAKRGNGRLDYGPWVPAYVNPRAGSGGFRKPVVVLANTETISMGEATVMAIKTMPNGTFVGSRTFGALAGGYDSIAANGGSFKIMGIAVNCPPVVFRLLDGNRYEGIGLPPDIPVKNDMAAIENKQDLQLEAAIKVITKQ
jgi:hypothetical protein